jgi:hypothetical protein
LNRTLERSFTASGPQDPAREEANQTADNPHPPVWTASQGSTPGMQACACNAEYAADSPARLLHSLNTNEGGFDDD